MRTSHLLTVSLFVLLGACSSEPSKPPAAGSGAGAGAPQDASAKTPPKGDAQSVATELTTLLAGVKDSAGAQKASAQVTTLSDQLGGLLASLKSTAADPSKSLAGQAGDLAKKATEALTPALKDAAGKLMAEVNRILGNADLAAPLKDSLTKLKGVLPQ